MSDPGAVFLPAALIAALSRAHHVCVLTGSGISAESGVPTFRDAQTGLWAKYDPQELATPDAFERDPALVWRWYRWRRELVAEAEPNAAHRALVKLAERVPKLSLITQNVDGLHQRAGSSGVVEFHGNIFEDRCHAERRVVEDADHALDIPLCAACGGQLRPGVVWFGENIPAGALALADAAVTDCDVFLSIGTSALVWPAAGLAEQAHAGGATVVEINLDLTPLSSRADYCLTGKAGSILPELVDCLAL